MRIVLMGPPASGKGTQAEWIADRFNIPRISTGDMLRKHVSDQTELGKLAQGEMNNGELVPDELVIRMMKERLEEPDCKNGFLLDGYPRTLQQARAMDETKNLDLVLYLDVSEEEIVRRMSGRRSCPQCKSIYHIINDPPKKEGLCDKCGSDLIIREDDREETVRNRLKVYDARTAPLIPYYTKKNILKKVNANGTIEDTTAKVRQVLDSLGNL